MQRWRQVVWVGLIAACLLGGCYAPQGMPPFLVLLTPTVPTPEGQCTGAVVSPREIVTAKHCVETVRRAVTVTGQEAWIASFDVSQDHDIAILRTDRVLWVSAFADFANPELGMQATLYGYCPYIVSHVARHAFYNGLVTEQVEDWPDYDYGLWIVTKGKVCGGDSGTPVLQRGKVVGIISLANKDVYAGKLAYTVPTSFVREMLDEDGQD